MPDAIDASKIPGSAIDPDAIEAQAAIVRVNAAAVRDNGSQVHAKWQGMSAVYVAPEADTLLGLMHPVSAQATQAGDNLEVVAAALTAFAHEVRPIKDALDALRVDAEAFRRDVVGPGVRVRELNPAWVSSQSLYGTGGYAASSYTYGAASSAGAAQTVDIPKYRYVHREWHEDQGSVDRNNELIAAVDAQQVLLWQAERACANKIRALYGAAPLRSFRSEDDKLGYGLDEIPQGTEMPWGAPVERSESCGEAAVSFVVKDFLWEGVIVGGVWGTVQGLGTLVLGYDPATGDWFSGDAYGAAWGNLGNLALGAVIAGTPPLNLVFMADDTAQAFGGGFLPDEVRGIKDRADEAWLNTGKALVAWDEWQDDPGTALGETVFNVATIVVPAGAAVAGVKTAGTAASVLSKMARVVDLVDPGSLAVGGAVRGGGFVFHGLDDLLRGSDSLVKAADGGIRFDFSGAQVLQGADASATIDFLVDDLGVRLDDIRVRVDDGVPVIDAPGIRVELPPGAFDLHGNAGGAGLRGLDADLSHVPDRELVTAGGAHGEASGHVVVDSIVDDARVRADADVRPDASGHADATGVRDPGTTTGGDAHADPSGSHGHGGGSGSDAAHDGGSGSDVPRDAGSGSDAGDAGSGSDASGADADAGQPAPGDDAAAPANTVDAAAHTVSHDGHVATYPDSLTVVGDDVTWVVDGQTVASVPIEDYVDIRDWSMHNVESDTLVLGKFYADPETYVQVAQRTHATYFDMGIAGWGDVQTKFGLSNPEMFEFFNKPALDDAVAQGKTIRFSHDPREYMDSALFDEWTYLKSHHGFAYLKEDGSGWIAVS